MAGRKHGRVGDEDGEGPSGGGERPPRTPGGQRDTREAVQTGNTLDGALAVRVVAAREDVACGGQQQRVVPACDDCFRAGSGGGEEEDARGGGVYVGGVGEGELAAAVGAERAEHGGDVAGGQAGMYAGGGGQPGKPSGLQPLRCDGDCVLGAHNTTDGRLTVTEIFPAPAKHRPNERRQAISTPRPRPPTLALHQRRIHHRTLEILTMATPSQSVQCFGKKKTGMLDWPELRGRGGT